MLCRTSKWGHVGSPEECQPWMTSRHTGFIAHCQSDPDFATFLFYHWLNHMQAMCAKSDGLWWCDNSRGAFLGLLAEIKELMESRAEDISLLQDIVWIQDWVFLSNDVIGEENHLNCELQDKGKTVSDMISAENVFKATLNMFCVHIWKWLPFPEWQCICIWGCRKVL